MATLRCAPAGVLFLFFLALTPPNIEAITVVVSSNVFAPECCFNVRVTGTSTVTVSSPEPAWHAQPITFKTGLWLHTCGIVSLTYDASFCCVGTGNYSWHEVTYESVPCPIRAQARALGSVGGYGLLPYVSDIDSSLCIEPCYCEDTEPF
jgi:hypothetical protein